MTRGEATEKDANAAMRASIAAKTGVSAQEWVKRLRATGFEKHGEMVRWLKTEHGLTHGYANFLALAARDDEQAPKDLAGAISRLFDGNKSALRPSFDRLLSAAMAFGPDVEVAPKRANVSLRRKKQFALLQPSTADRLDVGLILKGTAATKRLEAAGSFNAMCTHRVRVASARDVDEQLIRWLRLAYDAAT